MPSATRLLVKLQPGVQPKYARAHHELRPLHPAEGHARPATNPVWYLVDLMDVDPNPWDAAHSLLKFAPDIGVEDSSILCVEPDLMQRWLYRNVRAVGNPPSGSHFAWHLDDDYSQLRTAR